MNETKTPIDALARVSVHVLRAHKDLADVADSVDDFELQCCIAAAAFAVRRVSARVTQLMIAEVEKEIAQAAPQTEGGTR